MRKITILFLLTLFALSPKESFAQGKYGKDSAECVKAINFYLDYYKSGYLNEAAPFWRNAFKYCPPGLRQTIYIHGQEIFKDLIKKNENSAELKRVYVDSLMMMYDLRVKYFPSYATEAKTRKAIDIVNLKDDDDKFTIEALNDVIKTAGNSTDPSILVLTMQRAGKMYSEQLMSAEDVLKLYSTITPIIESQMKQNNPNIERAKKDIDDLFAISGVASCENIETLFTPRFDANPNDKDQAQTIVNLLSNGNCENSKLYLRAVEVLHKIEPSSKTAYYLAKLYIAKKDYNTAKNYLQEAIKGTDSDDIDDAKMLLDLSAIYMLENNMAQAVSMAKEAAQKDPESAAGKSYMIQAQLWATQKCGGNEIESRAKYWVAVDYLMKAKKADSKLTEEANKLINTYSSYFPKGEDAFLYDIVNGATYTVNCGGMRETTIVRTRQ